MKCYNIFLIISLFSCTQEETTKRFKITDVDPIDVSDNIIDFETEQLISRPYFTLLDNHLIIQDASGLTNKFIHIFNKNTLEYLTSIGDIGEGPGEFMNSGKIAIGQKENEFWMPDHSKLKVFRFDLDSAILDSEYKPTLSLPMKNDFFLTRFQFISDSIAIGSGVEVLSPSTFRNSLGIWNIKKDSVSKFGYEHPSLVGERTNAFFSYSKKHQMLALAYSTHDILSVFDLDGNIKFNIIGEREFDNEKRSLNFFNQVIFAEDQIVTTYLGDFGTVMDEGASPRGRGPSKFLFFNLEGNLKKVIETNHEVYDFTVDKENRRIFCYFIDREIPIGYFQYD